MDLMKKVCTLLLAVCLLLPVLSGQAEVAKVYTDVPGMPTQDSVCLIQLLPGYLCQTQPADEYSMQIFDELFPFVYVEKHRPVRYYDEQTQKEIEELIRGTDPDILHMSEYMTILMSAEENLPHESDDYLFDMLINVAYEPGQLVIAVIGTEFQDKETLGWHPYLCDVTETGRIVVHIPNADIEQYKDTPVLLNILTDRDAGRDTVIWWEEEIVERIVRPSKTEEELRRVVHYSTESGTAIEDNFKLFTVPKTDAMNEEIARMRLFLEDVPSLYTYFSEEIQNEMQYLFPENTEMDRLIAYEIIAVRDENYRDTYGDVAAELTFAVQYSQDQHVVATLGFPKKEEATWEWTCMRADVRDGGIETIFEQLMLVRLDEEPGLLIILSEPIP